MRACRAGAPGVPQKRSRRRTGVTYRPDPGPVFVRLELADGMETDSQMEGGESMRGLR
jgi:hypothetical protein